MKLEKYDSDRQLQQTPSALCWCGSRKRTVRFKTSTYRLLRCDECGTYSIDPPPISTVEEASEFYTRYYAGEASPVYEREAVNDRKSRFWRVVAKVPSLGEAGNVAVDVGCGDGRLCAELKQAGWKRVIGTDVSRSRIRRARERFPELFYWAFADSAGREGGILRGGKGELPHSAVSSTRLRGASHEGGAKKHAVEGHAGGREVVWKADQTGGHVVCRGSEV